MLQYSCKLKLVSMTMLVLSPASHSFHCRKYLPSDFTSSGILLIFQSLYFGCLQHTSRLHMRSYSSEAILFSVFCVSMSTTCFLNSFFLAVDISGNHFLNNRFSALYLPDLPSDRVEVPGVEESDLAGVSTTGLLSVVSKPPSKTDLSAQNALSSGFFK